MKFKEKFDTIKRQTEVLQMICECLT